MRRLYAIVTRASPLSGVPSMRHREGALLSVTRQTTRPFPALMRNSSVASSPTASEWSVAPATEIDAGCHLGQFFGVWGVRLTNDCIGGYCQELTPWTMYVNGQPYRGDPASLVLKEHQEIAFVIGTPPKNVPATYKFPAGL